MIHRKSRRDNWNFYSHFLVLYNRPLLSVTWICLRTERILLLIIQCTQFDQMLDQTEHNSVLKISYTAGKHECNSNSFHSFIDLWSAFLFSKDELLPWDFMEWALRRKRYKCVMVSKVIFYQVKSPELLSRSITLWTRKNENLNALINLRRYMWNHQRRNVWCI